jgi:hypothetical protein
VSGVARAAFLPAALVLLACAGLVGWAAFALTHVEAPHLYASAACLAVMAVGLAWARPWAYAFALQFFSLLALAVVAIAAGFGYAAVTQSGGGDGWGQVRLLVLGSVAVGAALVAAAACALAVGLWLARRRLSGPTGIPEHVAFAFLGLVVLGWLGWSLGYEYAYRELPTRDACLARGAGCQRLTRAGGRFSGSERRDFALAGCTLGREGCSALFGMLTAADTAASPGAQALAARCAAASPLDCQRLGEHLLKIGDQARGASWLAKGCGDDPKTCKRAAESAIRLGEARLADQLLTRGCERDEPYSCTLLLRRIGPSLGENERRSLHLKVCLLTNVNECLPLIRADMSGVCPEICDDSSPNRMQSCDRCASHAESVGERSLAERWWTGNCQRGHRPSCTALERLRGRAAAR